jgi:tRNA pseudouridine55 synthase
MATGVLVLAVGEATKLVPWLTAQDKSYDASVELGVETDTGDANGAILKRERVADTLREALAQWCERGNAPALQHAIEVERARTLQVPPAHSAIRVGGVRAYSLARRGEELYLPPRSVGVLRLEVTACRSEPPGIDLSLDVTKGYYVRALARDLAQSLGTVGHLTQLRRVRSGAFSVADAVSISASSTDLIHSMQSVAVAAARALPAARLTDLGVLDARHGRKVRAEDLLAGGPGLCAWLDARGTLVAVGEVHPDGQGSVVRGFAQATSEESPRP